MAGFEDLIRGALQKQDNPNQQAREKIYDSARGALTRMLDGNSSLTPEVAKAQKEKLESAIEAIEKEYGDAAAKPSTSAPQPSGPQPSGLSAPAASAPTAPPATPTPSAPATPAPAPKPAPSSASSEPVPPTPPAPKAPETPPAPPAAPPIPPTASSATAAAPSVSDPKPAAPQPPAGTIEPPSRGPSSPTPAAPTSAPTPTPASSGRQEPTLGAASSSVSTDKIPEPPVRLDDDYDDLPDGYLGNTRREKKPFARLLLWTIILVGLGVAIWWGITNVPRMIQELQSNVPDSNLTLNAGPATSGAQDEEGWLTVFAPQDDAQNVVTKGAGAAELQQDGNRPIMRLASPDASLENNLLIRLPRGTMQDLRGKSATFELVIRSGGAEEQSFAIFCDFGALGDCGRKRFSAGSNPKPELFDVLINDADLAPGEDAYISINTDFEGNGRPLDIYSIRVRESG